MKQSTTLLIVVGMLSVFGAVMILHLNAWEKRIKEEVLAVALESCHTGVER